MRRDDKETWFDAFAAAAGSTKRATANAESLQYNEAECVPGRASLNWRSFLVSPGPYGWFWGALLIRRAPQKLLALMTDLGMQDPASPSHGCR